MNKRRKQISILTALVVVAVMLFGCGGSDDSASSAASTAPATTSEAVATEEVPTVTDESIVSDEAVTEKAVDNGSDKESNDSKDDEKKSSKDTKAKSSTDTASAKKKESSKKKTDKNSDTINVSISIDCLTLYQKDPSLANKVSSSGTILGKKTMTIKKSETVLDVLKKTGISFSGTNYITSINGLSEKDGGKLSGWMYMVDGEVPMQSCDEQTLKDGQYIQWRYTCNNGSDI